MGQRGRERERGGLSELETERKRAREIGRKTGREREEGKEIKKGKHIFDFFFFCKVDNILGVLYMGFFVSERACM